MANTARLILQEEKPPTPTTSTRPTPFVNKGLIIGLVILGCILVATLIGIFAVVLYIKFTPSNGK